MSNRNRAVYHMVITALIAGIYTALSLALAPLSFGVIQVRFSEAIGLLAVFSPAVIWGVTLGCLISNIIGVIMGINIAPDILFGTLATLLAAALTYLLRNIRVKNLPVCSCIPPILINALVIGAELTLFYSEGFVTAIFIANAVSVGLGQVIPCAGLGLLLVYVIQKTGLDQKLLRLLD